MSTNARCVSTSKRKDLLKRNPMRLAAIVYWAISSIVKRPKTALICGNKQSMASKFAAQSGFDTVTFLPKHLLQQHGYWLYERAAALGYEPGISADVSRDNFLAAKVVAGFDALGKEPLLIKQRTIDEQYSGLNKLDWLHIEDASAHLLLVGAMNLLARDKPIITLNNLSNDAARKAAITVLSQCAYQCFDYTLAPINADEKALDAVSCTWVCIHRDDDALKRITDITSFDAELALSSQLGANTDINAYYNSLISYKTLAKDVLSGYLFCDNQIIDIEAHLLTGFYAKEHNSDDYWNWSGPSSESKILLAIESAGQYSFSASIFSLPEKVSSMPLYVFVDGELRTSVVISTGYELAFDFTVLQSSCCSGVEILFCIPKTTLVEGEDIGFSLSKVKLSFQERELQ